MKIMRVERELTHTEEVETMTEVIVEVIEVVKEAEKEGPATTTMCITAT